MQPSDPKPTFRQQKHQLRALFRSISFVALIGVFCIYNHFFVNDSRSVSSFGDAQRDGNRRRLDEEADDGACGDVPVADPAWHLTFYTLGILYMFLALAIVCDEFFVPALEVMSSGPYMNLSMDVAGATLMAAGGSAPELFTALFGTFKESAVGFGTIVGSAVFNVLFVIGMCSWLSKDVLTLTWWPLFRDSMYYILALSVLGVFVGVISEGIIELWEALVLFALYIGYVVVMANNDRIHTYITNKASSKMNAPDSDDAFVVLEENDGANTTQDQIHNFHRHSTFRAGVLKLITDPKSWSDTAGINMVAKIEGDVDDVFSHIDKNGNMLVDRNELRQVFAELECFLSDAEFDAVYSHLDEDKDGMINKEEFTTWYVKSEKRMMSNIDSTFKKLDSNNSGTIGRTEVKSLLHSIDPTVTEEEVTTSIDAMYQSGDKNEITLKEFSDWYVRSLFYENQKEEADEASEGIFASLRLPKGGCWAYTKYVVLLPLVLTLAFTVPDVRRPGLGKYCYISFFFAIGWIGVYSYFMVDWAEIIGNTLGIPPIVMGLTFLAAGTSVPDLLSSVIVARRGQGDMAVSSSIGSNIFDILVGLPLPWIIYTAYPGKPSSVTVGADGVGVSIAILIGMIILIISTIHFNGWKLTKSAGTMMFVLYLAFVAQAILRELPFDTCG